MATMIEPVTGSWRDYGVTEADEPHLLELAVSAFHLVQSARVRRQLVRRNQIEWRRLSLEARALLRRLGGSFIIYRTLD